MPTLVEVKRSTDTRIRREVVGQMLDYAANALSYWNVEAIKARVELGRQMSDASEAVAEHLGADIDPDPYWERVGTNLAAGRVRMVFVADVIPPELRAIVESLNRQTSPADVLAIEIRQYVDDSGEHQTLVPRPIGDTQAARRGKGHTPRATWSEQAWLESFRDTRGDAAADLAKSTMSWARDRGLEVGVGTAAKPSALLKVPGRFTLITITHHRGIEIYMGYLQRAAPFDDIAERQELKTRLEALPGVKIDERRLDKSPSFPLDAIAAPAALSQFTDTFDWVLARIEHSTG